MTFNGRSNIICAWHQAKRFHLRNIYILYSRRGRVHDHTMSRFNQTCKKNLITGKKKIYHFITAAGTNRLQPYDNVHPAVQQVRATLSSVFLGAGPHWFLYKDNFMCWFWWTWIICYEGNILCFSWCRPAAVPERSLRSWWTDAFFVVSNHWAMLTAAAGRRPKTPSETDWGQFDDSQSQSRQVKSEQ